MILWEVSFKGPSHSGTVLFKEADDAAAYFTAFGLFKLVAVEIHPRVVIEAGGIGMHSIKAAPAPEAAT